MKRATQHAVAIAVAAALAACGRNEYQEPPPPKVTVATTVFFPPTLLGTLWGMNFHAMPELSWTYGYPLAILAMIASGFLPYLYFKRRGWL